MEFTSPRATLDETLAFANAVREAGGGNPLDALMPAIPQDQHQCLIAKNLNFNCYVTVYDKAWGMYVEDKELALRIANNLGLTMDMSRVFDGFFGVYLPPEIGEVASDFDAAQDIIGNIYYELGEYMMDGSLLPFDGIQEIVHSFTEEQIKLVNEMRPYIEASALEAMVLGHITPDGKLVL